MPTSFLENGAYVETITDVPLASRPAGSIAVPKRPDADSSWDGTAWQPGQPEPIEALRARMVLPRDQLFKGLRDAGIISAPESVAASNQGIIPPALELLIAQMPEPQQSNLRIDFGDFKVAHRMNPLVSMLAGLNAPPLDDAAIDAFFLANMEN